MLTEQHFAGEIHATLTHTVYHDLSIPKASLCGTGWQVSESITLGEISVGMCCMLLVYPSMLLLLYLLERIQ